MIRKGWLLAALVACSAATAHAQVGMPGIEYSGGIAAFEGGQLYPYDRQDPWLHGYYQRVPAYGGFSSFRPYNYRHVFAQTQISTAWGMPHGMPYSQQFWNRYRGSYLNGDLHAETAAEPTTPPLTLPPRLPITTASYPTVRSTEPARPQVHILPKR